MQGQKSQSDRICIPAPVRGDSLEGRIGAGLGWRSPMVGLGAGIVEAGRCQEPATGGVQHSIGRLRRLVRPPGKDGPGPPGRAAAAEDGPVVDDPPRDAE